MLEDEGPADSDVVALFPARQAHPVAPAESLRLIRAFIAISDPAQRLRIIEWVEQLSSRTTPAPR